MIGRWSCSTTSRQTIPIPRTPTSASRCASSTTSTISDAILHVKYTAREDAGPFKNAAIAHLRDYLSQDGATPSLRMFDLRQEFPTQWHRFLNPTNPANGNVFELEMSPRLFPFRDEKKTLKVNSVWLLARCKDGENYAALLNPPLAPPPAGGKPLNLPQSTNTVAFILGKKMFRRPA